MKLYGLTLVYRDITNTYRQAVMYRESMEEIHFLSMNLTRKLENRGCQFLYSVAAEVNDNNFDEDGDHLDSIANH